MLSCIRSTHFPSYRDKFAIPSSGNQSIVRVEWSHKLLPFSQHAYARIRGHFTAVRGVSMTLYCDQIASMYVVRHTRVDKRSTR